MILLAEDFLIFELPNGEQVPCSPEMAVVELTGDTRELFDPEFVEHAAKAVFHYFKSELGRQKVTAAEFAAALEKVLRGFAVTAKPAAPAARDARVVEYDLCRLAFESGHGRELVFFPRLRAELQRHLREPRGVVRFRGLRGCVKHLTGARRWSPRCEILQHEIVDYLRQCLSSAPGTAEFSLLVE